MAEHGNMAGTAQVSAEQGDFEKAVGFFQQAIGRDPNYALAYSGLADTYTLLTAYSSAVPREVMPKAKEAALKALELDDNLAEAHASLGQISAYYDFDFTTAEREYRRAIELNPNYPSAHQWLAEHLSTMKRFDEALAEIRRALELDPLSLIINRIYADILVDERRFDVEVHPILTGLRLRDSLQQELGHGVRFVDEHDVVACAAEDGVADCGRPEV